MRENQLNLDTGHLLVSQGWGPFYWGHDLFWNEFEWLHFFDKILLLFFISTALWVIETIVYQIKTRDKILQNILKITLQLHLLRSQQ